MAVLRRAGRFAQKTETQGPLLFFSIDLLLRWLFPARAEGFEILISGVWENGGGAA
jgi:hypothetical protein